MKSIIIKKMNCGFEKKVISKAISIIFAIRILKNNQFIQENIFNSAAKVKI